MKKIDEKKEPLTKEQQQKIKNLIEEGKLSQDSIAKEAGCSQTTVSRYKRKMGLSRKSKHSLSECMKNVIITQPSTFFIYVEPNYRDSLAENLIQEYPDTADTYGIIHIKKTSSPSGLLIFSNNHNLMQELLAKMS